ncbi:MAG TPA: hypothetical protein VHR45_23205 [Thermoanaerobaculia bacterium]|nr:hypothetical protein [Thermoanaerobaculia bacterium]
MNRHLALRISTLALLSVVVACTGKKEAEVSTSSAPAAPAVPAAAAPAGGAPAVAAGGAAGTAPATQPAAASGGAAGAAPSAAGDGAAAETTAKLAAAQWALRQDEIKNDPDGQWAVEASASSSYNNAKGNDNWSAMQATGAPNVERYADDGRAWAPSTPDGGIEWLDLKYVKPVHASEVRVRESAGSGAVIKLELFDQAGTPHLIWSGNDPTTELNYLIIKFKPTDYLADRVKVTLATNVIPGWNEIDAVQLVGKP